MPAGSLIAHCTGFCRALRERGVLATPAEAIEAARALGTLELSDRADVYFGLRAVLTTRSEDLPIFDALFAEWWPAAGEARAGIPTPWMAPPATDWRLPAPPPKPKMPELSLQRWASALGGEEEVAGLAAPSAMDASGDKDFRTFDGDQLAAVERLAARIARTLTARPSRRWKPARRGARVDLRRTLRQSLRTGGEAIDLARMERKRRKSKIVALCDVSGSMDLYSRFLLQFLYALQHRFARMETFVFSTRLTRVTTQLERVSYAEALSALGSGGTGWSGGTRIGDSVAAFLAGWPSLLDRRTIAIVLSDGWDTGDPFVLSQAMRVVRARAGRVIWLNPLLGSSSYRPLTRGMQAALPHIDVFAPAHDLASLEALARHLVI